MRFAIPFVVLAFAAFASAADPVVAFGDSITRGERTGVKADETFAAVLGERFKLNVANAGLGGERTDGALARLQKDVLAKKPKVVLIMYGTNDSYVDKGAKEPRLTVAKYRENLVSLVVAIRKTGAEPILMTEPRWAKGEMNGLGETPTNVWRNTWKRAEPWRRSGKYRSSITTSTGRTPRYTGPRSETGRRTAAIRTRGGIGNSRT